MFFLIKFREIRVIIDIPKLASTAARAIINTERAIREGLPEAIVIKNLNIIIFNRITSRERRTDKKNFFLYTSLKRPKIIDRSSMNRKIDIKKSSIKN